MKTKFICDTNVIVSAFLFGKSIPKQAFDLADQYGILLFSLVTLTELEDVLSRKKFDRYVSLNIRKDFIVSLKVHSQIIDVQTQLNICRDPKDNKFLELAVSGKADYLITGDLDLLVLNPFENTTILTPAQFLEALAN